MQSIYAFACEHLRQEVAARSRLSRFLLLTSVLRLSLCLLFVLTCRCPYSLLCSWQAQTTPAATPAPAAPDPRNCCSKKYEGLEKLPCDLEHYCNYQNDDEWKNVNQIGWIVSIITGGIVTVLVLLRDIMQVWDCFGAVDHGVQKPDRQLTTMSAAYAPNTIGEMNEPTFYKADVALGTPMPQMFPQQPMYAPMGMAVQPMGFTPNYVPQMGQPQGQPMYGSA